MADRQPRSFLRTSHNRITVALGLVLVALVTLALRAFPWDRESEPAAAAPKQLFIAIDGLSWESFEHARALGMFSKFTTAGRLIAPYPSMSHPSWTEIMGTRRLFGARGNIRSVESRWFDVESMRIYDDPREVIARQAGPFNYMRAFDTFFDPLIEPLMYFPGHRLFDKEVEETERDILNGFTGQHYAVYVSGSDAMAHTHKDSLYAYLSRLDAALGRVIDSVQARDSSTQVWIISDHGNTGAFTEGQKENYLTPITLNAAAKRAGMVIRDSGAVQDSNEVAVVTIAMASMFNTWFPDLSKRRAFATEAVQERGVSLATWNEFTGNDRYVVILTKTGEAQLRWSGDSTQYTVIRGNPLAIAEQYWSTSSRVVWMSDSVARSVTQSGPWPDAPRRLVATANKMVENAPDLIINLEDGFCSDGQFGKYVPMVRTHGSLSARPTLGVIAGTVGHVPEFVRADEAMSVMHIDERTLFGKVVATHLAVVDSAVDHAKAHRMVATDRQDHSVDASFQSKAQPIVISMGYFPWDRLRELAGFVSKTMQAKRDENGTFAKLKQVDVLTGLTGGVDELLELGDSLQSGSLDTSVEKVNATISKRKGLEPLAELLDAWSKKTGRGIPSATKSIDALIAARQTIMIAWTFPAFLDAALSAPETDSIADTRSADFASRWIATERADIRARPDRLLWTDAPLPARLFKEVFTERQQLRRAAAGAMPLIYNPDLRDVTVVLLPGIYTELFDNEIWQRGLRAVHDNLGLRTIALTLDGRCSSDLNAKQLLASLRSDTRRRLDRGYSRPRYLLLGYSKGGVDATEALLSDSAFAHEQVAALVTIASPNAGSPVPERYDLPALVTQGSARAPLPDACTSSSASSSTSPQVRNDFWTRESQRVAERTRLFSLSFVSSMDDAHPWMKITKRIGTFGEDNDGVVTLSSSRFPASVPATDLGVINGDHIAGRRASTFPQEAFIESIVITLGELGALDSSLDEAARTARKQWLARNARMITTAGSAIDLGSDTRPKAALPGGSSGWNATATFRTFDGVMPGAREVALATPALAPKGIDIRCDQRNIVSFRAEYEFAYDGSNGGRENNLDNGFSIVSDTGTASHRACRLATRETAIKMTTASLRFRPADFSQLSLRVRVAENVKGVDPTARRRGANDAAFKLWFVLRDTRATGPRSTRLFGYTWNAPDTLGVTFPDGAFIEALSSKRSLVVKTLPEAWLVAIGNTQNNAWQSINRDFAADLRQAYRDVPADAWEVVAITFQSDSDESHGRSLSFLDHLTLTSREHVANVQAH